MFSKTNKMEPHRRNCATAQIQKQNLSDRKIVQSIRRSVMADKRLWTCARTAKIADSTHQPGTAEAPASSGRPVMIPAPERPKGKRATRGRAIVMLWS